MKTPTDEEEAIRRAEWLTKRGAPIDWVVLTTSEVTELKCILAAVTAERDALQAYVGAEMFMSDYRTATEMRVALESQLTRTVAAHDATRAALLGQISKLTAERDALEVAIAAHSLKAAQLGNVANRSL